MDIQIGTQLGVRISGGIVIGPGVGVQLSSPGGPLFLFRDDFTTAQAAPLTSPRTAEPGPGSLTLVQTDGEFSISSGKLNFPAQASAVFGDQGILFATAARVAGRTLLFKQSQTNAGAASVFGWLRSSSLGVSGFAGVAHGIYALASAVENEAALPAIFTGVATSTEYQYAIVLRGTGAYYFVKGGVFTNWTLAWVGNADSTATLYAAFSNFSQAGTLDNMRGTDLAAPFDTDYGFATDRKAGSVSALTTFTHEANTWIEWTQTTLPVTQTDLHFRKQDANNYWLSYIDSSGAWVLYEVVAGVPTSRASAAGVISNGHRIAIIADGSTIKGYSNKVLRWTYSSASNFATATVGQLSALGSGAVSDILTFPLHNSTAESLLNAVAA